jgi:hypothetical protein
VDGLLRHLPLRVRPSREGGQMKDTKPTPTRRATHPVDSADPIPPPRTRIPSSPTTTPTHRSPPRTRVPLQDPAPASFQDPNGAASTTSPEHPGDDAARIRDDPPPDAPERTRRSPRGSSLWSHKSPSSPRVSGLLRKLPKNRVLAGISYLTSASAAGDKHARMGTRSDRIEQKSGAALAVDAASAPRADTGGKSRVG